MTDANRRASNVTVEQMIGNMTSGMHNNDRNFIQLGFTPPPSPSETHTWTTPNQIPKNPYIHQYNLGTSVHNPDPHGIYNINPQYNQQGIPYNYVQPSTLYNSDSYEPPTTTFQNQNMINKNGIQDIGMYQSDYRFFTQDVHNFNHNLHVGADNNFIHTHHDNVILANTPSQNISNPTQLIENVVGNWVPNTSGTYSPFGNMESSTNPSGVGKIFELNPEPVNCFNNLVQQRFDDKSNVQENDNSKKDDLLNFHFNRDSKKPRMVAEVKPMRPSYSDVLTKSAPQVNAKIGKNDVKDLKQKKENSKKVAKNEKTQKLNNSHRLSNSDIKTDKNVTNLKVNEKTVKGSKNNNLGKKWDSLDNMNGSGSDLNDDSKKSKKSDDFNASSKNAKVSQNKTGKRLTDFEDAEPGNGKIDALNITKASIRKGSKFNTKQRGSDSFGSSDKPPPGKRNQRVRKRDNHVPFGFIGQKIKQYFPSWWKMLVNVCLWLWHLISDILSLSAHLSKDIGHTVWNWLLMQWSTFIDTSSMILNRINFIRWIREKVTKKKTPEEPNRSFLHNGLQHNIAMPATGEEAMKRLLACKGKDPYSILGVTPTCTDDDIKKYYKRQAVLVHPDKNQQPGAEEAFKILVHAFDMIGKPERRAAYDRGVAESAQVEQAWSELTELLAQLQKKVEAAANTIRCSACGLRHKRVKIDRPSYAARNCSTCKIHHPAREGDIWAEARCLGFLWHFYACMEGGVYDITEWAGCQKDSLKHLKPDSHHVQYRIALGKQNNQTRNRHSPRNERPPDLENLLNSLYGNQDSSQNNKRRNKKSNNK